MRKFHPCVLHIFVNFIEKEKNFYGALWRFNQFTQGENFEFDVSDAIPVNVWRRNFLVLYRF